VALLTEPADDLGRALAIGAVAARHRRAVLGVPDRPPAGAPPSHDPSATSSATPPAAPPPGARP
jgi:hypothetical protein